MLHYLSKNLHLAPLVCALRVDRGADYTCACGVPHQFSPGPWLLEQAERGHSLPLISPSSECEVAQEAQALAALLHLTPNLQCLRWHFLPLDIEVALSDRIGQLEGFRELQMSSALTPLIPNELLYDLLMVTNIMTAVEVAGVSCVRLYNLVLREPIHLPASIHTLALSDCNLSVSDSEIASPWTGPGIRSLILVFFLTPGACHLPERFANLAPQIECLEIRTCGTLQEYDFVYSCRPNLRSFHSRFFNLETLKIEGALSLPDYLDPLPPVLRYLECRWPSIQPRELASLIRQIEDLWPSLQRVLWVSDKCSQQSDLDEQDQELPVCCRDLPTIRFSLSLTFFPDLEDL